MVSIEIPTQTARLRRDYKHNETQIEVKQLTKDICEAFPFEILGDYTKLFYDIDWKAKDGYITDPVLYSQFTAHLRQIQSHKDNEFVFTDGTTDDNFSFHVVFQKIYIKREGKVPRQDILQWLLGEFLIVLHKRVDKGVYSKNRKMRLPYGIYEDPDPKDAKLNPHIPRIHGNNSLTSFLLAPVCVQHKLQEGGCDCKVVVEPEPAPAPRNVIVEEEEKEPKEIDADRKNNLMRYLEVIKKERFQDRAVWLKLAGMMRGNGLKREDFLTISKDSGYKYFNEEDCNTTWYSLKENFEFAPGFKTLQTWCEEDGINWREMFCPKTDKMIKMMTSGINTYATLTQKTVAEVFFHYYKDNLYYVGKEWLHYSPTKGWEFGDDNSIVYPLMKFIGDRFSKWVHSVKPRPDEDEDTAKKMKKFLIKESSKLADQSFCSKCVKTSQSLFRNDKIMSEFDAYPDWFCFSDQKAINMTTGESFDVKQTHKILSTCGYPMPPRIEEHIQRAKDFILTIQSEKSFDSYMSCISTATYGTNKNQRFFIHTGSGSNGKSLIGKLIYWTLGDYAMTFPIEQLTQNASGRNVANSDLAQSRGKRYAQSNEPEDSKEAPTLKIAKVKELTGEETVKTRDLNKSSFELLISFTIHLLCNDPPKLSKSDKAIERRLECITYPYIFKSAEELAEEQKKYDTVRKDLCEEIRELTEMAESKDKNEMELRKSNIAFLQKKHDEPFLFRLKDEDMGKKLKQDKDLQYGLLYLMLDHWRKNNGVFFATDEMKRKKESYVLDNNPLQDWLRGYERVDPVANKKDFLLAGELLKQFKLTVDETMKIKRFTDYLKQAKVFIKEDASNGHKVYLRKKLVEDD
jgi:hypothetical protein